MSSLNFVQKVKVGLSCNRKPRTKIHDSKTMSASETFLQLCWILYRRTSRLQLFSNTENGRRIVRLPITKSLLVCFFGLYNWSILVALSTNVPLNQISGFCKLNFQKDKRTYHFSLRLVSLLISTLFNYSKMWNRRDFWNKFMIHNSFNGFINLVPRLNNAFALLSAWNGSVDVAIALTFLRRHWRSIISVNTQFSVNHTHYASLWLILLIPVSSDLSSFKMFFFLLSLWMKPLSVIIQTSATE